MGATPCFVLGQWPFEKDNCFCEQVYSLLLTTNVKCTFE